jgi:hypothetical protein
MAKYGRVRTNSLVMQGGAVSIATSTCTMNARDHAYKTMVLNRAAGVTITLPAATGSGNVYRVVVGTTVTSNNDIIQVANSTDEFHGYIQIIDSDTSDAQTSIACLDGDGFDTITMNGSTKGGIMGDFFEFVDYAAGKFLIVGNINGTGTVATPLSAAV